MLNCIIVDDEPIARKGLALLLKQFTDVNVLATFPSASEALSFLSENKVDLVFLDIQMPGLTGIEMAQQLDNDTFVVFVTAYDDYAVESYNLDAVDYLLKPINSARLAQAIKKVTRLQPLFAESKLKELTADNQAIKLSDNTLTVRADRGYARIPLDEIVTIQGLKDYVIINLPDKKIITKMTIKSILELLPGSKFLRVNKSTIVNFAHITFFTNNDIMVGDDEIAIGPTYRDNVMQALF